MEALCLSTLDETRITIRICGESGRKTNFEKSYQ
jgi:hypothetical protein